LVEDKLEKHHIVPRYRCVELVEEGILVGSYKIQGVEFYFEENMVQVTKEDHAYIHWGYFNDNLEALFKYVKPQQWIIDLIPRRDNRDLGATKITANGLIEDIDMSGENHPRWGTKHSEESKKKISNAMKGTNHSEESKKKMRKRRHSEETKKKMSESWKARENHPRLGTNHSEESKKKISDSMKSKSKMPSELQKKRRKLKGENHPRWGTKHSEESKKKIGDASRGKTKKKRSESRKGKKYSRKKISFEQYFKIDEANRKKRMKQISYSLEDFLQALQLIAKES